MQMNLTLVLCVLKRPTFLTGVALSAFQEGLQGWEEKDAVDLREEVEGSCRKCQ